MNVAAHKITDTIKHTLISTLVAPSPCCPYVNTRTSSDGDVNVTTGGRSGEDSLALEAATVDSFALEVDAGDFLVWEIVEEDSLALEEEKGTVIGDCSP
jgi:hypothetical protein